MVRPGIDIKRPAKELPPSQHALLQWFCNLEKGKRQARMHTFVSPQTHSHRYTRTHTHQHNGNAKRNNLFPLSRCIELFPLFDFDTLRKNKNFSIRPINIYISGDRIYNQDCFFMKTYKLYDVVISSAFFCLDFLFSAVTARNILTETCVSAELQ